MDEENWVLYNGGDLSKGLNGPATKVLLALNTFQGTVFENLIALHAGVCASMIPVNRPGSDGGSQSWEG